MAHMRTALQIMTTSTNKSILGNKHDKTFVRTSQKWTVVLPMFWKHAATFIKE